MITWTFEVENTLCCKYSIRNKAGDLTSINDYFTQFFYDENLGFFNNGKNWLCLMNNEHACYLRVSHQQSGTKRKYI